MNTSGVEDPPEISVASVARFVSVFVGADTSVTWIFGFSFSNALISTVRVSVAPDPAIGLADHTIVPVADPVAAGTDDDPLLLLLEQPVTASAPADTAITASCQPLSRPRPDNPVDLSRAIDAPLARDGRH